MDLEHVGNTAGAVWKHLNEHGATTAIKLKSALGLSNTLLYLALGWLAREDKIVIEEIEQSYKVSLKI